MFLFDKHFGGKHTIQIMKDFSFLFTLGFQSSLVKMKTASETTTSTLKRSPLSKSWKVGKREEEFYDCFLLSLHNNLRAKKGKNGVQKEKRSYVRKNKCEFIQTISPCLNWKMSEKCSLYHFAFNVQSLESWNQLLDIFG